MSLAPLSLEIPICGKELKGLLFIFQLYGHKPACSSTFKMHTDQTSHMEECFVQEDTY